VARHALVRQAIDCEIAVPTRSPCYVSVASGLSIFLESASHYDSNEYDFYNDSHSKSADVRIAVAVLSGPVMVITSQTLRACLQKKGGKNCGENLTVGAEEADSLCVVDT
jgi:hypothetical protein